MIPLGILASSHVAAGGGSGVTYTGGDWSAVDSNTYTFTGVNFGAAAAGRVIVAIISSRKASPAAGLSSLTIGGVTATIDDPGYGSAAGTRSVIAHATVPTGTSGNVVATWDATVLRCHVALFSLPAVTLITSANTGVGAGTSAAQSVTLSGIASGDYVIAGLADGYNGTVYTWTGLTEAYEGTTSETMSFSGGTAVSTGTSATMSAEPAAGTGYITLVAAAYRA